MKLRIILFSFIFLVSINLNAYVFSDGIELKSTQILNNGAIKSTGFIDFQSKILPYDNNVDELDIIRLPFSVSFGLSNKRELGFNFIIDSQSSDQYSSEQVIDQMGIFTKFNIVDHISMFIDLGYSMSDETYFSYDGVKINTELLLDYKIGPGLFITNLGYEYVHGKLEFSESTADQFKLEPRFTYGIGYIYQKNSLTSYIIELDGSTEHAENFDNLLLLNFGFKHKLEEQFDLVGSLGAGLTDGSPDLKMKFGLEFSLGVVKLTDKLSSYQYNTINKGDLKASKKVKLVCPECGYETDDMTQKYCYKDGNLLVEKVEALICSVCGNEIPEGSNFCPFCGAKIKDVRFKKDEFLVKEYPDSEIEIDTPDLEENLQTEKKFSHYTAEAKKAFDNAEYLTAAQLYNQALLYKNNNFKTLYNLGVTYYFAEKYFDAKRTFEKARRLNNADIDLLLYLGAVNGMLGYKNEAISIYKRVLELDKNNSVARQNLRKLGIY